MATPLKTYAVGAQQVSDLHHPLLSLCHWLCVSDTPHACIGVFHFLIENKMSDVDLEKLKKAKDNYLKRIEIE